MKREMYKVITFCVGVATVRATATEAPTEKFVPPCNPALHCPSISVECFSCNPRTEENCDSVVVNSLEEGNCVEPAALDYDRYVYGMPYMSRCRRIVDPGYNVIDPVPDPKLYVRSCREGEYTCNDGTCVLVANYPTRCYSGIIDDASNVDHKCNLSNTETDKNGKTISSRLASLWEKLDHESYCVNNGGVRYGPFRCGRNFGEVVISSNSDCGPGEEAKPVNCVDIGIPDQLFGPSDACHATCGDVSELFSIPQCCHTGKDAFCSNVQIFSPSESIHRCDDNAPANSDMSKCSLCKGSDEFPYCCLDDILPSGNPACVNENGLTPNDISTKCGKSGGGLKGDICYVSSAGAQSYPPPVSDTGFGASGVELTFRMSLPPDLSSSNDCCCDVVCSCFGDPHCSSFFADYEVSQVNSGEYYMVDDIQFSLKNVMAEPLGVNGEIHIEKGNQYIKLDGFDCVYGVGIEVDGKTYSPDNLPKGIRMLRTTDEPTSGDESTWESDMELNRELAVNPTFVYVDQGPYEAEIKCVRFEMLRGDYKGWWNRMDVSIRRKTDDIVSDNAECCPSLENVYNTLFSQESPPSGYCFRRPSDEGLYIPGAKDLTNSGLRRLRLSKKKELITEALNEARQLEVEFENVVTQYSQLTGISAGTAKLLAQDQGIEALSKVLKYLEETCHYHAFAEEFDYRPDSECVEGLILEAKLPTQSEWTKIKFFPKHINYCDNKILVLYQHTMVGKRQLSNAHELRLTHCTPKPGLCGVVRDECRPTGAVEDVGVSKYVYGNTLSEAYLDLVQFAADECACKDNPSTCITSCLMVGTCPVVGECTGESVNA